MKTFTCSLMVIALFTSCSEDPTYCFTCTVTENGQTSEFTKCDITQDEADDIARDGTIIDPDGFKHIFGVTLKKHTVCRKGGNP